MLEKWVHDPIFGESDHPKGPDDFGPSRMGCFCLAPEELVALGSALEGPGALGCAFEGS